MDIERIEKNAGRILNTLPPDVKLVAAAKTRTPEEVEAAIRAGVVCFGQNYLYYFQNFFDLRDFDKLHLCQICLMILPDKSR